MKTLKKCLAGGMREHFQGDFTGDKAACVTVDESP